MEELKKIIATTIVESLEQDFLDKKYSLGLNSHNCLGMMRSDVINTKLEDNFSSERYIIRKFNRSGWEGRFIIDLETKSLISITTILNLNNVLKAKRRKTPHYMQTLSYWLNGGVETNQQMCFEGFEKFNNEVYEEDFKKILSGLNVDFNDFTYYIVAYNFKSNKVIDMKWYLLGAEFNIAEEVSMMQYVKPNFVDLTSAQEMIDEQGQSTNEQPQPSKRVKLGLKKVLKKER